MTATVLDIVTCSECRDVIAAYDAHRATRDRYVCFDCVLDFFECDVCDLVSDDTESADDGNNVCASCQQDHNYYPCAHCETLIQSGDYCDYHQDIVDADDTSSVDCIHSADYKPAPDFHGTGPLYLGMELEITVPGSQLEPCASEALDWLGALGYLKEDSSIKPQGFELVTHPMSYAWAMKSFPWPLLRELAARGCRGEGNGLHVHISRDAFTDACHIYRWMKFVHRNASDVQVLARRVSHDWAAFTEETRDRIKHTCKGKDQTPRYSAINTQNDTTYELRVFASSLRPQQVQAALAFAAASVEYTRILTVPAIAQHQGWEWATFIRWLDDQPQYAPLTREWEALACAC